MPDGGQIVDGVTVATMDDGGSVSSTVTVKVAAGDVLPESSTATQETSVAPIAKVEPDAGVQVIVGVASTLSVAVTGSVTIAPAALVASAIPFLRTYGRAVGWRPNPKESWQLAQRYMPVAAADTVEWASKTSRVSQSSSARSVCPRT